MFPGRLVRYASVANASCAPRAAAARTAESAHVRVARPLLPAGDPESLVLYKDRDIIALNKPSGLSVHAGPKVAEDLCSHLHLWQYDSPNPPNLAHRLDRDTSGVILLSRHSTAAREVAERFQRRKIKKTYWAITVNVPSKPEGIITIPLGSKDLATQNSPRHRMHRVILRKDKVDLYREELVGQTLQFGIQMALTEYRVLSCYGQRCSLIEVETATGFKHQVRVHLGDGLLCPVVGDYKFGGPLFRAIPNLKRKLKYLKLTKGSPMCLHAYQLCIPDYHGHGKPLVIRAPPPASFRQVARQLMLKIPK